MKIENPKSKGVGGSAVVAALGLAGLMLSACGGAGEHRQPTLEVHASPAPEAGMASKLAIRLRDAAGRPITRLEAVHEKPLHFLIMSRDLAFFAHEHPEPGPGGEFALDFTFPRAGEYVVFGDYKPEGGRGAVSAARITVRGPGVMKDPDLGKDDLSEAKRFGSFEVKLDSMIHGGESMLTFTITREGRPVSDLRPYLGALGHLVIVDPSASSLLHSHPMDGGAPGKVSFHTKLQPKGVYKLWAEFRPEGLPLRAEFVIEAPESGSPAHSH